VSRARRDLALPRRLAAARLASGRPERGGWRELDPGARPERGVCRTLDQAGLAAG
jgi:hypothetical protein